MRKAIILSISLFSNVVFGQVLTDSSTTKVPINVLTTSMIQDAKNYVPNYSPLSPNAAAIQKYGDYQINMATGLPNISMPIYTAQDGKLSLPITLRYHASGHRIDELASWVGWGWSLDFGGALSRTINGLADDKALLTNYLNTNISSWDLCTNPTNYTNANAVNSGNYDIEPDLYSYATPEVSGKFQLQQGGLPAFLIPFEPVQVTHDYATENTLKTFQIIAPSGNAYVFGGLNNTEYQSVLGSSGSPTLNGVVTWQLSKIMSPNTDDVINCTYQDGGTTITSNSSWSAAATFFSNGVPTSYSTDPFQSLQVRSNTTKNIQKITFTNGEVEFIQSLAGERLDMPDNPYLKTINIYNYQNGVKTLLKKFDFEYSYFTDRTGTNGRLKLDKLIERNASSTEALPHIFDYFSNTYSWKYIAGPSADLTDMLKQDYFGYFNGKLNNHLIDIPIYNGITILNGTADRNPVSTYMKEGVHAIGH
jgi:hypothetical protein